MKIKDITLSNFSKYDQVNVSFDDNITYLIGKNGSGKSTLGITAIWFMFCGIAEKASGGNSPLIGERFRFIGPKAATARGEMTLVDEKTMAEIKVHRKLTKTGTEVAFEGPEGLTLDQKWLTDLFNVFLISPKMFCQLSPKEQANALGIDTSKFDAEIGALKLEHTAIGREIKAFGDLQPLEEVQEVDVKALQVRRENIRKAMEVIYRQNQMTNKATREAFEAAKREIDGSTSTFNLEQDRLRYKLNAIDEAWEVLEGYGYDDAERGGSISAWREELGKVQPRKIAADLYPAAPTDLSEKDADYEPAEGELVLIREIPSDAELKAVDAEIAQASETNKKALLYQQYLERKAAKEAKEKDLSNNKAAQAKKQEERGAFIASFKFPFSNLTVGDDGELLLAGKPIKEPYFSTGEILKVVPILLSTSNPELKYVFLQDFNLMDEDKQAEVADYLTGKGFQLVVELVGKKKVIDKNCILLRDNVVVEDYEAANEPQLSI